MRNINSDKRVYIYALVDPRNKSIRYVGWTSQLPEKRLCAHLSEARLGKISHRYNWLRELLREDLKPEITILEEISYPEREEKERYWIAYFGRESLVNGTDGGEGSLGYKHSPEVLERLKIFHQNRKEETNRKISETKKSLHYSSYWKGKHLRPETIEKLKLSKVGTQSKENNPFYHHTHTKETKEIMSQKAIDGRRGESTQGKKRNFKNKSSSSCGVSRTSDGKWIARISKEKVRYYLGYFDTEIDAIEAYNAKALELYGPEARINQIGDKLK